MRSSAAISLQKFQSGKSCTCPLVTRETGQYARACVWESVWRGCACSLSICGHLQTSCYCLDGCDVLHTHIMLLQTAGRTLNTHAYKHAHMVKSPFIIPWSHTHGRVRSIARARTNPSAHPRPSEQLGAGYQTARLKCRILENKRAACQELHP